MPTLQYPKSPNTDTAFVVQDDGTKNRALMTAPQDTSTLELPSNPNSTKGYVTIDGKKQRVVLTADISGAGGDQHNLGYYATLTDLQTAYPTAEAGDWAIVGATDTVWIWDDTTSAWVDSDQKGQVTSVNNQTGDVTITGADILPSQTGNAGKFLVTDVTDASWGNALTNTATGTGSLTIGGTAATVASSTNIGVDSESTGQGSVAVGYGAKSYAQSVAVGVNSEITAGMGVAIGCGAKVSAAYAIQIGGYNQTNSEQGTIYIGSYYNSTAQNYKLLDADGTIPTARLTKVNSTITIAVADWNGGTTATKSVTGITTTGLVFVSPDPTDQADYTDAGIICSAQAADSLTFTCDTTPTSDIDVVVVQL